MFKTSLIALAIGTFALGISEFTMMGILTTVASDFQISIARAGDFISAYSLGVACGAPSLLYLSRFPMKQILVFLCLVIFAGNVYAASSAGYASLLAGRFLSGLPHGAYFGAASIMATRLADPGEQVGAVAVMMTGMTVANVVGVPLSTWLANAFTWRLSFALVAVAGLLAVLAIWFFVPRMAPMAPTGKGSIRKQFEFLRHLAPWLIIAGTFFGQGSLYCWYSYVEPIMLHVSNFSKSHMTYIMALAGLGMVVGGLVGGKLSDHFKPGLVTGVISLLAVPILVLIRFESADPPLSLLLTFLGAACIFGLGGPLQYLIVRFSPGGEMLGGACIQVAFNVSNACAAYLGGMAIHAGLGLTSPALVGIPLALAAACVLFYFNHRYARME